MKKLQFFGVFLISFAILLVIWGVTPAARWYTGAVLAGAGTLGPLMHGWVLSVPPTGQGKPVWSSGQNQVQASIQFDAMAIGLVPLIALLIATPGVPWGRRLGRVALGLIFNFFIGVIIVAMFPLLVFYQNAFTDVLGTFLGLIAFVGAPAILWFVLSFRELQGVLPSLRLRVPQR
ncbi:MAG: hypothetical protein HY270_21515 [Deltaproteobacteria bacterium]|nr:hypothetical protein [Deltaproteobacteria bacterium]